MHHKLYVYTIALFLSIQATFTTAAPYFVTKRWSNSFQMVLQDILLNQFPQCDIILLQDDYFAHNMNGWMVHHTFPYYSITLDGKPFPDYTTWKKITKTTGLCTTVIAACITFESCRNSDSPTLFKMLSANGILLKERRAILYIDKYDVEDSVPYILSVSPDRWLITHETPVGERYNVNILNKAGYVLQELKSHITVIRDVSGMLSNKLLTLRNLDESHDVKDKHYETLTFSPNWIPGGTPLVPNLWIKKRGFILPFSTLLDLTQIRPGGVVKFCVSSKRLLPFIGVSDNGTVRGLGAEIIRVFARTVKIQAEFIEPSDRSGGKRDKNGNWTGQIGYIFRRDADIGIGQVIITHDKIDSGLKFSPAVLALKAVVVCPIPRLLPRYQILAYPFDTFTWICLLASFIISVIIIDVLQRIIIRWMPLRKRISMSDARLRKLFLGTEVYVKRKESMLPWIQSMGPIFLRSIPVSRLPSRWAILGLFSVWLVFTFITAASYVTVLIGALSAPPKEPYVHSPAHLVQFKSKWVIASLVSDTIEDSTVPAEVKLFKKAKSIMNMPQFQNLAPDVQVYSYVNATGNCGVSEEFRAKFYIGRKFNVITKNHKRQLLYVSKGSFFIGTTGWVLRNDIDFLIEQYLDKLFLAIPCYGLQEKMIRDWFPKKYKMEEIIEPLNFETLQVVFIFGAVGLFSSFLVFLGEVIAHKVSSVVRLHRIQKPVLKKQENELYSFVW